MSVARITGGLVGMTPGEGGRLIIAGMGGGVPTYQASGPAGADAASAAAIVVVEASPSVPHSNDA